MAARHPCPFTDEVLDLIGAVSGGPATHSSSTPSPAPDASTSWRTLRSAWSSSPSGQRCRGGDTVVGDARALPFADASFHAIATSPCFGNRMADHHEARDPSVRHTYRHRLGRPLSEGSAGALQWGPAYREFHERHGPRRCGCCAPAVASCST